MLPALQRLEARRKVFPPLKADAGWESLAGLLGPEVQATPWSVQIWDTSHPLSLELPLSFNRWWPHAGAAAFLSLGDFCLVPQATSSQGPHLGECIHISCSPRGLAETSSTQHVSRSPAASLCTVARVCSLYRLGLRPAWLSALSKVTWAVNGRAGIQPQSPEEAPRPLLPGVAP